MPLVFQTPKGSPTPHDLVNAGYAGADGQGGIVLSDAAETMPELQNEDGKPLTGGGLKKAAEKFAESRGNLEVNNVPDSDVEAWDAAAGGPTARESAEEYAKRFEPEGEATVEPAPAQEVHEQEAGS